MRSSKGIPKRIFPQSFTRCKTSRTTFDLGPPGSVEVVQGIPDKEDDPRNKRNPMVLAAGDRRRRVSGPLGGILRAKSMAGEAGPTPFKSHEKRGSWGACRAGGRHLNYLSGERRCSPFLQISKEVRRGYSRRPNRECEE